MEVSPNFLPPKIEDPSQEEWGIKGVESESRGTGFPLPRIREDRPRFHEDKLGGNDPPEAGLRRTGVLGVSPNFLTTPKIEDPSQEEWGIKGVERDHYGQSLGEHIRWIPCQETV
jgi:hypothetical protein